MTPKNFSISEGELAWQELAPTWKTVAGEVFKACERAGVPFGLRAVLLCVRDMAYARPERGQTADAALREWCGTCSTKHLAVHQLLHQLGLDPRLKMARFVVDKSIPLQVSKLRSIVEMTPVHDVHNFIECDISGYKTLIDVTFPSSLASYGFTVTKDWSIGQNFQLACMPSEVREVAAETAVAEKQAWLNELNQETAHILRERVILDLAATMKGMAYATSRSAAIDQTLATLRAH